MREHGGADILRSLGAAPFQQLQTLQFVLLLLQLLDDSVIRVQRETFRCRRGRGSEKDASSLMLRRIRRITSRPTIKAKPAATNISAMRSTMGLVTSFTATPSTS